jgi:DNA repair protein RecO (recombination protein O)
MFGFIKNALLYFDLMEQGSANFHLYFLFRLTEYLGFFPEISYVGFEGWFDMRKGAVVPFEPSHPLFMNKEITSYLVALSVLKFHGISEFKISRRIRESLLSDMIGYYQLHFDNMGEIKSLKVLRELFD